jgi:hypothetical protein
MPVQFEDYLVLAIGYVEGFKIVRVWMMDSWWQAS